MAASMKISNLKACEEVLFVSTQSTEESSWNVAVFDTRTGNLLQSHRNGSATSNTLCVLGGECLLAASPNKPVIHVWNMLRQGPKHRKLICGGKISSLAVTPDNNWMAGAIEDKIHLWQVCTGELYAVLSHSSVEVKSLQFTPSSQHLVSAYKDGTLAVWELQDVLVPDPLRISEARPVNTFSGHSGEITDVYIGLTNTVITCGTDFTVRVWSLLSKEEQKLFELGNAVTSVAMDHSELTLYAGDSRGNVFCIDLQYKPEARSVHIDSREPNKGFIVFPAHSAAVKVLRLTQDNSRIVSASDDMTVKIWSMMSPVHPVTIDVNEQVCDIIVCPVPKAIVNPDLRPKTTLTSLNSLKRNLHEPDGEDDTEDISIEIPSHIKLPPLCISSGSVSEGKHTGSESNIRKQKTPEAVKVASLKEKASKLKKANEEMYQFAVQEIIK